jgi:hypothetical protein
MAAPSNTRRYRSTFIETAWIVVRRILGDRSVPGIRPRGTVTRRVPSGVVIVRSRLPSDIRVAICASVQRGLRSRAYTAGRLSVRREAGEHLFHQLLYDERHG